MRESNRHDHTLLLFFTAIFIFNSPLTSWWSYLKLPWYAMFVVWAAFILLAAVNFSRDDENGH